MESKITAAISVQNLIEFSLQSGDLGAGSFSAARAAEGTRGHNVVRKALRAVLPEGTVYSAEVPVSYRLEGECTILEVSGRIDGILQDLSGITIHEIKTTTLSLHLIEHDHNPQHWIQAKCYAFIYALVNRLDSISICLTYYQIDAGQEKSFTENFSIEELRLFFIPLVEDFLKWQDMLHNWHQTRNSSITELKFPYQGYRKGQRKLAAEVYRSIKGGSMLFAQAPTGTGKTIATIFPAIKALGEELTSKIFYLTAKTTTREIAEKAVDDLRNNGLRIKSVTITAKEKICLNSSFSCDPEYCEYARNYYGKVRNAINHAFKQDCLDRSAIEECAAAYAVCPFELSLDISLWCDVIICDYNYLFDPRVFLRRFFRQQKSDYCFLIDEAHNLVDRAREMFSAEISKKAVLELKRVVKAEIPGLYDITNRLNKYFINIGKELAAEEDEESNVHFHIRKDPPEELHSLLIKFTEYVESWLSRNAPVSFQENLLDLYFSFVSFIRILELYDDKYTTYYEKTSSDFKVTLFCLDPSILLREAMNRGRSSDV